jgi:hypothetical protein
VRNELTVLLIATLFASAFAGTMFYSNRLSQTGFSSSPIFQKQVTNLSLANLSAHLERKEVIDKLVLVAMYPEVPFIDAKYNNLWITGWVTNTGKATAFNAGLQVTAYSTDGSQKVNITVPFVNAVYGIDKAANEFIQDLPGYFVTIDGVVERGLGPADSLALGNVGILSLGSLASGSTVNITLAICYEGTFSNWTVTPVWTNNA